MGLRILIPRKTKFLIISFYSFLLFTNLSFAQNHIYNIDGYLEAYFPGKPILFRSSSTEMADFKYYYFMDKDNLILYMAKYGIRKDEERQQDQKHYYESYLAGLRDDNGEILKKDFIKFNSMDAMTYTVKYKREGVGYIAYAIVFVNYKTAYQWEVREIEGLSKLRAKDIFNEKVNYFKVLR